ncbi:MAG: hypothetical protein ACFCD0_17335 [Gemmataceae bacterium]
MRSTALPWNACSSFGTTPVAYLVKNAEASVTNNYFVPKASAGDCLTTRLPYAFERILLISLLISLLIPNPYLSAFLSWLV